jgi:prevent-host-death family protein
LQLALRVGIVVRQQNSRVVRRARYTRTQGNPTRTQIDRATLIAYVITYLQGGLQLTTITATEARRRLYNLLEDVADSHEPIQIAGKRHSAVLVSESDWRAIQETLFLESIPGMRASIIKGLKTPVAKCTKDLTW